jgi:uncharacterized protein (DUF433 family)
MDIRRYISLDPRICHGKPCFKGTRIMVSTILELLESGLSYSEIKKGYPSVNKNHIRAALHFAHELIDLERFASSSRFLAHAVSH